MTEKQINLVKDYGPKFCKRSRNIKDEILYLCADACSVLTDMEWRECGKAIENMLDELNQVEKIVHTRMKKAGVSVE